MLALTASGDARAQQAVLPLAVLLSARFTVNLTTLACALRTQTVRSHDKQRA